MSKPPYIDRLRELEPGILPYFTTSYINGPGKWFFKELVKDLSKRKPESRIMDLGCGYGNIGLELMDAGYTNYHGVDIDEHKIIVGRQLYQENGADPERLQVQDLRKFEGTWDIIFSLEVLYDIPRESFEALTKKVAASLTDEGLFIFTHLRGQVNPPLGRNFVSKEEVFKLAEEAGLKVTKYMETPWASPTHKNSYYVMVKTKPEPRTLIITVDADYFPIHGQEFHDKIMQRYPGLQWAVSFQANHLEKPSNHETAIQIMKRSDVEVWSHSYTHPFDWRSITTGQAHKEIVGSCKMIQKFMDDHKINKTVKGILWTGACNPAEHMIFMAREEGLLNFNGYWRSPPYVKIGKEVQYTQRAHHELWNQNNKTHETWDEEALEWMKREIERPAHVYIHFHSVAPEFQEGTIRLLNYAANQVQEGLFKPEPLSNYIQAVEKDRLSNEYRTGIKKWSAMTMISRNNEKMRRAVNSILAQGPDEYICYVDPEAFTPAEYMEVCSWLREQGATPKPLDAGHHEDHYIDCCRQLYEGIREAKNQWVLNLDDDDEFIGKIGHYFDQMYIDVGAVYGHKIQVPKNNMIRSWDVTNPYHRDMRGMRGSAIMYNRDAFENIHLNLDIYRGSRGKDFGYWWEYKVGYWLLRAGYHLKTTGTITMIQNLNQDRKGLIMELAGTFDDVVRDRDQLRLIQ